MIITFLFFLCIKKCLKNDIKKHKKVNIDIFFHIHIFFAFQREKIKLSNKCFFLFSHILLLLLKSLTR